MINRKALAFLFGAFAVLYTGTAVMADDTEIYDGTSGALTPTPLVMFTIDYSPSVLGSTVNCTASVAAGLTEPAADSDICAVLVYDGYLTDNDADWHNGAVTTRFGMLIAALKYIINDLDGMKIGLMMSHNSENNCAGPGDSSCSGGGYILMGFTEIGSGSWNSDSGKSLFFDKLDALKAISDAGTGTDAHTFQGKEVFFEFFRYITGHKAYSSHLGWTDFGTNDSENLYDDNEDVMRDLSIEGLTLSGSPTDKTTLYNGTPGTYTSPLTEDCQKVFTMNFLKGVTNQEDDADAAIINGDDPSDNASASPSYTDGNGSKAHGAMNNISLSGKANSLETVLAYLHGTDFADGTWGFDDAHRPEDETTPLDYDLLGEQNVTSYFFVDSSGLNTGHDWAKAGGTQAAIEWGDDPQEILNALENAFDQILSTSTTFTAASVPVSVLNRAQIVDNVFIALFKSDPDGYETWPGNVKRLRLDTDLGILVDAEENSAINPIDGRINNSALTFWTAPGELPAIDPLNDEVVGKDGRAVKRGGAGQQIPGFRTGSIGLTNSTAGARQVFYEPSSGTAFQPLNVDDNVAATELQTDLGAASVTEALTLLKYVRGFDVLTDPASTTPRTWIMGDPLHSRPLPINYGNASDGDRPDIRLVFGSNDGLFRMVQNTVDSPTLDAADDVNGVDALGVENWAFMPRAVMGIASKLRTNNGSNDHPYGVDGAPTVYIVDADNDGVIEHGVGDTDKAWVFFGLRRGGRAYYALDITNPDAPTFKWSIEATGDFAELGYSFSQPRVGYMNWGSGKKPVVIFSGGYQLDKDDEIPHDGSVDAMGNAFYIVDADTGALIWKVADGTTGNVSTTEYNHTMMDDSIPSTVTAVDTDGDTLLDRAYVGDTGGRVWRFDMIGTNRSTWKATVIASVGYRDNPSGVDSDGDGEIENDRRFFHRPDFIQYKDGDGDYDAVVIASGNRAHPMKDQETVDHLYVIKDRDTTGYSSVDNTAETGALNHSNAADFYDVTDNCLQDGGCSDSATTIADRLELGWKLKFEGEGEKSLATPTTLAKKIFVTTYLPKGGAASPDCKPPEGGGRLYALSLENGSAVNDYSVTNGDTLAKEDRYTDLASGGIPAEVVYVPFNRILKPDLSIENVGVSGRWKTYWYKKEN